MSSQRLSVIALVLVLLAQVVAGVSYIERTTLSDGPTDASERVYVLWDDAMISMRYARNLAAGDGFVWNPNGERVQGYTNLGLALVMAAVHKLGPAPERAALWIQLLALACLLATAWIAASLVRRASGDPWAGLGAALALLICSPHQIYALQGSDTIFVSVLLLAGCARLTRRSGDGDGGADYSLDGFLPLLLAVLVRPDASVFVVCAACVIAVLPDARGRLLALAPLAVLAGIWAGLIGFSLSYYGDPLPNTWYLKATGSPIAMMLGSGFSQLAAFGLYALPFAFLALGCARLVSIAREPQTLRLLSLLTSFVAVGTAYHVWVGGDWMRDYGSRHLVQQIPLLIVLGAIGAGPACAWLARLSGRLTQPVPQALGAFALILSAGAFLNPPVAGREWFDTSTPTLLHAENQGNFDRARFLARTTRADTTVAAHWAGVGPYFAGRESLDVLGRSDRHIARMHVDRFVAGHSKWDWDYVLETRKPDIIDFESRGLKLHPIFLQDYAALVAGPQSFVFIRKDAVDKILDPELRVVPLTAQASPTSATP